VVVQGAKPEMEGTDFLWGGRAPLAPQLSKHNLGVFLCIFFILGLFFSDLSPCFCFYFTCCFFFNILAKLILGLFFGKITYFGFVFQIYLLVFAKSPGVTVCVQWRSQLKTGGVSPPLFKQASSGQCF